MNIYGYPNISDNDMLDLVLDALPEQPLNF